MPGDGGSGDEDEDDDAGDDTQLLHTPATTRGEAEQAVDFTAVLNQLNVDIAQIDSIIDSYKEIAARCVGVLKQHAASKATRSPNDVDADAMKQSAAAALPGIIATLNTWCALQSKNRHLRESLVAYLRGAHARVYIERLSSNLTTLGRYTNTSRVNAPADRADDQLDTVDELAREIADLARPVDIPSAGVSTSIEIDPDDFDPARLLDGISGAHRDLYAVLGLEAPGSVSDRDAVDRGRPRPSAEAEAHPALAQRAQPQSQPVATPAVRTADDGPITI